MKIRKATLEDLKTIQDLNYQLFVYDSEFEPELNMEWPYHEGEEYFKDKIAGDGVCLVAEVEEKIVGYLAGGIREGEGWLKLQRSEIENMFVLQEFRGMGIGAKLVQTFKDWSKEQGVKRVVVNAFFGNKLAVEFYSSFTVANSAYKKNGFEDYDISLQLKL